MSQPECLKTEVETLKFQGLKLLVSEQKFGLNCLKIYRMQLADNRDCSVWSLLLFLKRKYFIIEKDRKKCTLSWWLGTPTRWGTDIAEQPRCLLIYTVHTGSWEEHGQHCTWCLGVSCSSLGIGSKTILEDVIWLDFPKVIINENMMSGWILVCFSLNSTQMCLQVSQR